MSVSFSYEAVLPRATWCVLIHHVPISPSCLVWLNCYNCAICILYHVDCERIHVPPLPPVDGIMIKSAHNMSICSIQPIDVFLSSTVVWNWAYHWVSADSCQMHVHVHYVCTYRNSLCLKKRPQCSSHLNESCYTWSPC